MLQRRAVIDYALARRAVLADLQRGLVSRREVCDAHPDLLRAAKHHGEVTDKSCPLCPDARPLTAVIYVFGTELGESSGRARAHSELDALSRRHCELRVCVVEVCRFCSWNHLQMAFAIGTGERPGHRRATGK